jgi:hypothetical protein
MAEPVTSMFVPQSILDLVSPQEAEAAATQARNTFIAGLLSGDIGAAYNNAQNQGYNTLSHGASLQEAKRKQAEIDRLNQLKGSAYDYPNPIMPMSTNGTELAGPGIPQPAKFNPQKMLNNPMAPFVNQGELKNIMENFGPKIEFVNGMAVDKRNIAPGTMIPKVAENQMLIPDASVPGGYRTAVMPGAAGAVATLEGAGANAREAAKAQWDIPAGGVLDTKTGNMVAMSRAQIIKAQAEGRNPILVQSEAGKEEGKAAGKFNIEQVLTPAKLANDAARSSNINISTLRNTVEKAPLNQFTNLPFVQEVAGYAKAAGMLTPEAASSVTNLAALNSQLSGVVLQEQIAQKGTQTKDDATRMESVFNGKGDKDATMFALNSKEAQNNRNQQYYSFLNAYRAKHGTLEGADYQYNESPLGKASIFRESNMKQYAKQIVDKDGKVYRVFGDGGPPELVK